MKRQRGMVVLTTVMMLGILMILMLSLTQSSFLYIKATNALQYHHELFYQLEKAAFAVAAKPYSSDCLLREEDANQIVALTIHAGCVFSYQKQTYTYSINDLGLFPCLAIKVGNQFMTSHHWLITVAAPPPESTVIQFRVANADNISKCELSAVNQINAGMVSWRYIPKGQYSLP